MGKKVKKRSGRTRIFKSPAEMQKKIDEYFNNNEELTITGLCLALGFKSRQALINYEGYSKTYYDTIKKAKLRIEEYYEKQLSKHSCTGAIFWLKCRGDWKDRQHLDITAESTNINIISFKKEKKE